MGDGHWARSTALDEPQNTGERDFAFLSHVIRGLTSTLELNEVLTMALEELRHLLNVTASSIWLIDPTSHELVCLQATGPQQTTVRGWRVPAGIGLIGWIVEHGRSLVVAEAGFAKQGVVGGDDVLDLRAGSRFEIGDRMDEYARIGN